MELQPCTAVAMSALVTVADGADQTHQMLRLPARLKNWRIHPSQGLRPLGPGRWCQALMSDDLGGLEHVQHAEDVEVVLLPQAIEDLRALPRNAYERVIAEPSPIHRGVGSRLTVAPRGIPRRT